MITPITLKKGDTIGIVSTARKVTKDELQPAINFLESWGLTAELGKTIDAEDHQFAGSDNLRAEDFQAMLDNPTIKSIWCARGGYGTVRIIDKIDFSNFKKNPKWIIGYSDMTVLHAHINNLGVETLHAQIFLGIESKSKEAAQSIKKVLFGESYNIQFKPTSHVENSSFSGELIGGNLSVLYSLLGSSSAIKTDGKILFIEDLDEYLYHIDRMMMNLKRSGMLKNLKALIVGGMTDMNDNAIPFGKTAEEIIFDTVKDYEYPVIYNFPAGHINDNRALIMGRKVTLEIQNSQVTLSFN
ncbi:LD-carboxypeptidase [Aequorivita viscosa]|nr:LD-carboxypeptidase [Aequorivita viscosa]